jgi:hypothetical protein
MGIIVGESIVYSEHASVYGSLALSQNPHVSTHRTALQLSIGTVMFVL